MAHYLSLREAFVVCRWCQPPPGVRAETIPEGRVGDMGAISSTPLATVVFGTAARLGFADCTVVDEDVYVYIKNLSKSQAIQVVL